MKRRTAPYELNIRETSSYKTELSCFPLHAHALRLLMGKLPCFNLLFIASVFYQQKTELKIPEHLAWPSAVDKNAFKQDREYFISLKKSIRGGNTVR